MRFFADKYAFFLEIAQCGGITKAAEKMMISQPALSKYLSRLEASLETKLFDRSVLPIKLTAAGEIFLQYAISMGRLERQCIDQLRSIKDNLDETLRIGTGSWLGTCLLPHLLPSFRQKCPYVRIKIIEGVSDAIAAKLQKGDCDIAFLGDAVHYPQLKYMALMEERILMLGNSSNPLINQYRLSSFSIGEIPHVDILDFRQERFIMSSTRQTIARTIYNYFAKMDFQPIEILEIESLHTALYMTAHGDYISFLPEIALHTLSIPDNVSFFTFSDPPLNYQRTLAYSRAYQLTNAAKAFIEHVVAFFHVRQDLLTSGDLAHKRSGERRPDRLKTTGDGEDPQG